MSYRSKRTRAQMTMKEDEVQTVKKLNTSSAASSSQIALGGGDERWGPFRPPKDEASYLGTNKLLNTSAPTPAPDGSSTKSYKLQQIKNGQRLITSLSPHQKTHLTSPIQAMTSRRIVVPTPENLQSKATTTTCTPSNATKQVPVATKSGPIWRESSIRPSVGKSLIVEKKISSDPSSQVVGAPSTQIPISPRSNILKSTSPLPFATNRLHNVKLKYNLLNTTPRPTTQATGTQATSSPQTNNLKSTSSLAFATNRQHTEHTVKSDIPLDNIEMSPKIQDTPVAPAGKDLVDNVKPFKPRRHKVVIPKWPDEVAFDEKDEVMTIDKEGNCKTVSDSIQPHDVWHADGTKYFVTFNEFYQPLKMGGHILIRFIGDVAKNEKFCPIGETDWRRVSAQLKFDIVKLIRDRFVIPDGELFDKAILKRTGRSTRLYRHHLKNILFKPTTKMKEQIYGAVPSGHPRFRFVGR